MTDDEKCDKALRTWTALNDFLREAREETCQRLLYKEQDGRGRRQFIRRIHSRLNKARADRERRKLKI